MVSKELIRDLLITGTKQPATKVVKGIPKDAKLFQATMDVENGCVQLVFLSQTEGMDLYETGTPIDSVPIADIIIDRDDEHGRTQDS